MLSIPFFTHFLKISNVLTLLAIGLLLFTFFILAILKKKKVSFSIRMLVALLFGLGLGILIDLVFGTAGNLYQQYAYSEITAWFSLIGSGFLKLIQLMAVPVVFLSIIHVVTQFKQASLKHITWKTLVLLLGTTAIAAIVAVSVVSVFPIDANSFTAQLSEATSKKMETINAQSFPAFFLDLIPNNMFSIFSNNSAVVSVVIIGLFIANALRYLSQKKPEQVKPFTDFLKASQLVINSVLTAIIKMMPYGIVALVANTIVKNKIQVILGTFSFIVALYIAVLVMLVVYVVLLLLAGINPWQFYKKALTTMLFAFSSRSSVGTLPYTLVALDEMGVSQANANFVATLGTTIGMNGCAGVFPAMLGIILAKASGITIDAPFIALLVLVVTVGSIGIAGVPGTATVAATVTLNGIGLGSYMTRIGAIFGIDPIIDMGRTMLNVTGAMVSAIIVDKWDKTLDTEKFNQ